MSWNTYIDFKALNTEDVIRENKIDHWPINKTSNSRPNLSRQQIEKPKTSQFISP